MKFEDLSNIPAVEKEDLINACNLFCIRITKATKYFSPTLCKVYKIYGSTAVYIVKIYPDTYSEDELNTEVTFIKQLEAANLPVPYYHFTINNSLCGTLPSKKKAAAYTWINGEHLNLTYYRTQLLINIVNKLIQITNDLPYHRNSDWVWSEFNMYRSEIETPNDLKEWFNNHNSIRCPWGMEHKIQLCHNDISAKNIIWESNGSKPVLIDFTNSISAPLEWEFATMTANIILENSFEGNIKAFKNLLKESHTTRSFRFNWNYYEQLLCIALSQRSVFMVKGSKKDEHPAIWRNLQNAIKDNI